MDTDLFATLLYKLHETEALVGTNHPAGPSQFCRDCRIRVEYLMPVIQDHIDEVVSRYDD